MNKCCPSNAEPSPSVSELHRRSCVSALLVDPAFVLPASASIPRPLSSVTYCPPVDAASILEDFLPSSSSLYYNKEAWSLAAVFCAAALYPDLAARYSRAVDSAVLRFNILKNAFERSFMNYTPEFPDRWCDPLRIWQGHPDRPFHGSAVCLAYTALHTLRPRSVSCNQVQCYHEFLAAVMKHLPSDELPIALLSARSATLLFPEEPCFRTLIDALRTLSGSHS